MILNEVGKFFCDVLMEPGIIQVNSGVISHTIITATFFFNPFSLTFLISVPLLCVLLSPQVCLAVHTALA